MPILDLPSSWHRHGRLSIIGCNRDPHVFHGRASRFDHSWDKSGMAHMVSVFVAAKGSGAEEGVEVFGDE
jgi:hypothetical protein